MSISDKLRKSLSIEIHHYLYCPITKDCSRCQKLIDDLKALKPRHA